jgi:hypothetical protein
MNYFIKFLRSRILFSFLPILIILLAELIQRVGEYYFRFNTETHKYFSITASISMLLKLCGISFSLLLTISNLPELSNYKTYLFTFIGAIPILWLIYIFIT